MSDKVHSSPVHDFMMHSFIVRKASPEGYLFQASGVTKGRKKSQVEVCERRGKSFIKYFKGPFIKTSFLTDLFSRSICMNRVQLFNGRYTKGLPFLKHSIYKGRGLDLGAKPLRTMLY